MYERLSKIVLLILALLTIGAFFLLSRLSFDYNFENFFPEQDKETEYYRYFREVFETDNDFAIVGLVNQDGIFDLDFLERADSISSELKKIKYVEQVNSALDIKDGVRDPLIGHVFQRPLFRWTDPEKYKADSVRIFNRPELVGSFFSEDGTAILIHVRHKQFLHKQGCDSLSADLQSLVKNAGFDESYVVGRAIGQVYYVDMMQRELMIFMSISMVLIILFLIIAFRSWWGVWVPITVVLLSIIWTLAVMQLTGKKIDLMLTILPTILFVVGISDVVHIVSRYFEELRLGKAKIQALVTAYKEIGIATFLTSLTTAVGFITLISSNIKPISEFGIYTAIGVFVAFILAYTLLPAVLVLSSVPSKIIAKTNKNIWEGVLSKTLVKVLKYQKSIVLGSLVVVGLSIWGISKIEINNFILEDLKAEDPLKKEFDFFADKFSGARPFELSIQLKENASAFDVKTLSEIEKIENYLKTEYGVGNVMSHVGIIKTAHRTWMGGSEEYNRIPEDSLLMAQLVNLLHRPQAGNLLNYFVDEEKALLRLTGKVDDLGSIVFREKDKKFYDWIESNLPDASFDARITGTAFLIDSNNVHLSANMIQGLIIAFIIIAIIAGIMFKSLVIIPIALIPNMLPLLMIGGIMGFMNVDLKVSTSIIFTIAFGIAVDDTIHFLTKLRLQLREGKSLVYSIKRTFMSTGKAIIVTTLILCGGFMTLIASDFLSTFYLGLLISLTLIFAVISDLLLLPILILWWYKPKNELKKSI